MTNRVPYEEEGPCGCECEACVDPVAAAARHAELMKKHGWVVHCVTMTEEQLEPWLNIHTHGLEENFGHSDLQLTLPCRLGLPPSLLHGILVSIVNRIKEGVRLSPGEYIEGVVRNLPVRLARKKESKRTVQRVLLPDKDGLFPGDAGCSELFAAQDRFET